MTNFHKRMKFLLEQHVNRQEFGLSADRFDRLQELNFTKRRVANSAGNSKRAFYSHSFVVGTVSVVWRGDKA